jgi:NAD(P)H-dependent FMN reductase
MKLLIINGSSRQGQASIRVTKWVERNVSAYELENVTFETINLADLALPMFDEPISPMMNQDRVTEGSVKQWLDALAAADGYVIVTPEYNHAMSNSLKNAIDFIDYQIMKKPFIVVGHGGAGGARAIEQVKLTLNANIGAVPVPNSVTVFGYVGFSNSIDENGVADEEAQKQEGPLKGAVETLAWYAKALKTAREL